MKLTPDEKLDLVPLEFLQVFFSFLRLSVSVEANAGERVLPVPGSPANLVEVVL